LKTFQALLDRKDVRPGCVISIQTFGAFGANFHSHCHALVSHGAFSADGAFLPIPSLDTSAVMELFRRLLLLRLHQAERLTKSFMQNLLSWVHPGFSVYAGPPVEAGEIASLESQARYITRPALAMDALHKLDNGNLVLETPPDPRTGATSVVLDPLEWIHRITSHIPDPGRHCQRFYGAYSNRARVAVSPTDGQSARPPAAIHPEQDNSDSSREARSTWARLIQKIFETDPLLCSCGARMRIVSFITDPRTVDLILRHRESGRCKAQDPFEPKVMQIRCENGQKTSDENGTPVCEAENVFILQHLPRIHQSFIGNLAKRECGIRYLNQNNAEQICRQVLVRIFDDGAAYDGKQCGEKESFVNSPFV
jgi:hypothetical protein